MRELLDQKLARFEQLEKDLVNPEVLSSPARITAVAREHGSLMPPMHILNAPTKMMKELGYSSGYAYDHDAEGGFSGQNYFPEGMERQAFYRPVERGFEREILKRLDYWQKLRAKRQADDK